MHTFTSVSFNNAVANRTAGEYRECHSDTPSIRFTRLLKNGLVGGKPDDDFLDKPTKEITQNILNTCCCEITFERNRFEIRSSDTGTITIFNLETNEKIQFEDIGFSALKKNILEQYIQRQREQGYLTVDLSSFDLTGIDLKDIDFIHTIINRKTFEAIIANNLDVRGARLAADEDATNLNLAGVVLDKSMADSLISAGAELKSVLTSYLASPPGTLSHFFKADLLKQYLVTAHPPIDLSSFNLNNIHFKGINFHETLLSPENLKAIIANGGNLDGAKLSVASHLPFNKNGMDKSMVLELIKAGVEPKFALTNYFVSERNKKNTQINIDGFDLTTIKLDEIDLRDVDLSKATAKVNLEIVNHANTRSQNNDMEVRFFRNFDDVKNWAKQFFRFQGELRVGDKKFSVAIQRGRAQVTGKQTEQKTNRKNDAGKLQHILNSSPARKNEMNQMTHAALPRALQRLTPDHWMRLGNNVFQKINGNSQLTFYKIIAENFYNRIYTHRH